MDPAAMQTASLWDPLASVPDHRRAAGKRYPLASLLLIAFAAILARRRELFFHSEGQPARLESRYQAGLPALPPPSAAWSAPLDLGRTETIEKSHGRIETTASIST